MLWLMLQGKSYISRLDSIYLRLGKKDQQVLVKDLRRILG